MKWILISLFLNAQTGDLDHYTASEPLELSACVAQLEGAHQVKDNLAEVRICRAIDKDGKPIREFKVDPNGKPLDDGSDSRVDESPKVTT